MANNGDQPGTGGGIERVTNNDSPVPNFDNMQSLSRRVTAVAGVFRCGVSGTWKNRGAVYADPPADG